MGVDLFVHRVIELVMEFCIVRIRDELVIGSDHGLGFPQFIFPIRYFPAGL